MRRNIVTWSDRASVPALRWSSLAALNEKRDDLSGACRERLAQAWGPVRLCVAAEQEHGSEALPLCTATGAKFGDDKAERDRPMSEAALAGTGRAVLAQSRDVGKPVVWRSSVTAGPLA